MSMKSGDSGNLLAVLDALMPPTVEEMSAKIAGDVRRRRIERGLTRRELAVRTGVPLSTLSRFEQKGLISLQNLIEIAVALGYVAELRDVFAEPKYSTMQELQQIHRQSAKKRAYHKRTKQ